MAWCFHDETSPYAQKVLEALNRHETVTPAVWPLKACNVLVVAERKKRLHKNASTQFLALLNDLPIRVEQKNSERMFADILALAREHNITTYDASYLDLAIHMGLPLATLDAALRNAAKKSKVPLFKP